MLNNPKKVRHSGLDRTPDSNQRFKRFGVSKPGKTPDSTAAQADSGFASEARSVEAPFLQDAAACMETIRTRLAQMNQTEGRKE